MLYYSVDGKRFELPLAELYQDRFANYIRGNEIIFDGLNEEEKYKKVDELFGFVTRTFVCTLGEMEESMPDFKYESEVHELRRKVSPVDNMQKFFHENGKTAKAIEMMNKSIMDMSLLSEKVCKEDEKEEVTMEM